MALCQVQCPHAHQNLQCAGPWQGWGRERERERQRERDRERETERERDRERNCLNTAAAGVQWTADAGYSLQNTSVKGAGSENEIG